MTQAIAHHVANDRQRDSIYLHDSIFVRIRADTVWQEKWHTRWRERETVRTDTVQQVVTKTETRQVRYIPRFYKVCTGMGLLLLMLVVVRGVLFLYRRVMVNG